MAVWTSELHGTEDKLPTLSQWLKTVNSEVAESVRVVKLIWTPNLFDNYSLDTDYYRFRVPPSHTLFEILEGNLETWVEDGSVLGLSVLLGKKTRVQFHVLETEICDWDPLGEHGWKSSQIEAKPKQRAGTKTRKMPGTLTSPSQIDLQEASTTP